MSRRFSQALIVTLVSLFVSVSAQAQDEGTTTTTTVTEKKIILTPPPKSASCTTVAAHWEDNVWVAEQTVCKYEGRAEGVEWVQDYWACTVSTPDGNCTNWEFKPGHWIQLKQ